MALSVSQVGGGLTSAVDSGAVTTPAVNQVIADSGALSCANSEPGSFIVDVTTFVTGTAETNLTNMLINIGGTNAAGIISGGRTLGKLHSSSQFVQKRIRISVQNGEHVYIVAGNTTPTTGSIYNASLTVSRNYQKYSDV
jgi:hypothetical protein